MISSVSDARRMLVALLTRLEDEPVEGLEKLNGADRLFLIATCAARMIEETICAIADYDQPSAQAGIRSLTTSMLEHVDAICESSPRTEGGA